ncbi:MAG TPA: surface lipoprotein assembly modifier [Burkholderiales bacterium]|jgi:tetratricopeptide (TPR) repeat protein|nr:surface lipoprotein assembly modifier [Burkholderiales bacterium]
MRHAKRLALFFCFVLVVPIAALAADDLLLSAKQQLDSGNPQAAYNLLIPLQSERAGDPEYDFLLGSAALGIGKNTEAVFALERVLAVRPDATVARALIARAYFNLKETETAKREFENVRKQEVPEDVVLTIDRFLDAIRRVEETKKITIRGYIEVGGGYDSNVNSATTEDQVAVPSLGIVTLTGSSKEQADGYITFGGGVGIRAPVSSRFSVFGGVAYTNKSNIDENNFSTYSWDLNAGLSYKRDRDTVTLATQLNAFFVNDPALYRNAYREAVGATLQWQHDFNARNQVSAYAQYAQLTYPDQGARDADRYVGGFGYAHAFGQNKLVAYAGVYGGTEQEKDESFPQFGHDLYGARIGAQQFLSEKFSVFVNASAEKRYYGGPDPSFLVDREDTQYSGSGGIHFIPRKNLRLTLQGTYTDNSSNIPIYGFDRVLVSLILRTDF